MKWSSALAITALLFITPALNAPALASPVNKEQESFLIRWKFLDRMIQATSDAVEKQNVPEEQMQSFWPAGTPIRSGYRTDPSVKDDLFSAEFNPPAASFAAWTTEFLTSNMNQWLSRDGDAKKADLQAFLDLSQRAIEIWDHMVRCTGNEEAAREAYAKALFECIDGTSGARIREELIGLHGNVLDFLQTTDIDGTLEALNKVKHAPIIQMHPLLFQIVEETFAVWFPYGKTNGSLAKWLETNLKDSQRAEKASRMVNLIPLISFHSTPIGLWPTALELSHAYFLAKLSRLQTDDSQLRSISSKLGYVRNAMNCRGATELCFTLMVNPAYIIWQTWRLGTAIYERGKSIEPTDKMLSESKSGHREGWTVKRARKTIKRLRQIAEQYGITEASLFQR